MNKTKMIYFLSAVVCIIGCYALNLSYSLFVDTQEKAIVNSVVPSLSYSLETSTYNVTANSSELIKLKVINSGTSDMKYGIFINDTQGSTLQLVEKNNNDIIGELETSSVTGETTSKEVWLYVTNTNSTDVTLTFNIVGKYSTLNFDENFKSSSNIDCVNKIKLLNESILARAKSTEITDENKTVYDDTFDISNITGTSGETERALVPVEDDYGTSYAFRGNVLDNYAEFAGFTWRIVRINGDGSIRLILNNILSEVTSDFVDETNNFGIAQTDNAYVGYMYGTNDSNSYEETHKNITSSKIKPTVDSFYETYIENETNNIHYEKYLADTLFCGDKSLHSGLGYNKELTYYSAYNRLMSESVNPKLKCVEENDSTTEAQKSLNVLSRYTSTLNTNDTINSGLKINNDLTHPIAFLTADESVIAGAYYNLDNSSFYLNSGNSWWTMTPATYENAATVFTLHTTKLLPTIPDTMNEMGVRPVINLKADTIVEGNGTENTPYILK